MQRETVTQDLARGKAKSPLGPASQQQNVADKAEALAQQAPEEIAKPLNEATKSAATAASAASLSTRELESPNPAPSDLTPMPTAPPATP